MSYPWTPELRARADALNAHVDAAKVREAAQGARMFLGIPDRWFERLTWRCANGHLSSAFLKSEEHGMDLCLGCYAPVRMTFPEDKEGQL